MTEAQRTVTTVLASRLAVAEEERDAARAEIVRLRAVLEDYADASWYEPTRIGYDCGAVMDAGAKARAALAAKEGV